MRTYFILLFHEIRMAFLSPSTWIAWFLFLALMGFLYQGILQDFTETGREGLPSTDFFRLFWFPVVFMIPMLTMKSIAEEQRMGTLSSMFSTPVTGASLVLAKFSSAYFLYVLIWLSTLAFPLSVRIFIDDPLLFDIPSIVGSLLFIYLSGLLYVAIGIFTSSLTKSQLVAGALSFAILFVVLIGGKIITDYPLWSLPWEGVLPNLQDYLNSFRHLEDFSRGVLDTRPVLFYSSFCILFLTISGLVVRAKS
jgi:ABC-2 type transport system permease protein